MGWEGCAGCTCCKKHRLGFNRAELGHRAHHGDSDNEGGWPSCHTPLLQPVPHLCGAHAILLGPIRIHVHDVVQHIVALLLGGQEEGLCEPAIRALGRGFGCSE